MSCSYEKSKGVAEITLEHPPVNAPDSEGW